MDNSYGAPAIHLQMLRDDRRNRAFRDALHKTVNSGDVVLDFGAGTGILSMFAAQAGAARVFAVEKTSIAHLARRIVEKNGFADRIQIIQGDIETVRLPEKVDVIVSEWLGSYGVDENMLAPLLIARDRWLKPGGKMLPQTVTAWICPIWNNEVYIDANLSKGRPYNLDLSLVAEGAGQNMTFAQESVTGDDLMAEPQAMWTTDLYSYPVEKALLPFRANLHFTGARRGQINALTAWFSADFGAGIKLTNAPGSDRTHWAQYIFPLQQAVEVDELTPISIEFTCLPTAPGYCAHAWSVRIEAGLWMNHDTRTMSR
jgi:SAM-dependent methyltransferase